MSDPVAVAFGENLLAARKRAGMSQEELAFRSGLDRTTISQIERGQTSPRVATLLRVAGALGIEPGDLLPSIRWKPPIDSPAPEGEFH